MGEKKTGETSNKIMGKTYILAKDLDNIADNIIAQLG